MNILHNGAITLYHGDCLDVMHDIPDGSVDAIICDIPYGTTACKLDVVIPFEPMWIQLKRIIKPRGAIVLFGSQPFTSALVMSNPKMFRYEWIWDKVNMYTGALLANKQPLRRHENVLIFGRGASVYNKQWRKGEPYYRARQISKNIGEHISKDDYNRVPTVNKGEHNPCSILEIKGHVRREKGLHPTQKPLALLEYLIRTYTNEGETVLDFTFGSCTAGVAALTTKRRFIGIERDATYYALGVQRVQDAIDNLPPMDL